MNLSTAPSGSLFFSGDPAAILFARFLDQQIIQQCISFYSKDISDLLLGGVDSLRYCKEKDLLDHILYYFSCLLWRNSTTDIVTLGQAFCGLRTFKVSSLDISNNDKVMSAYKQKNIFSWLFGKIFNNIHDVIVADRQNEIEIFLLPFLYCILPYLFSRKEDIWRLLCNSYYFLISPEDEAAIRNENISMDKQDRDSPSLLGSLYRAIVNSVAAIAPESNLRIERFLLFINDIHLLIFALFGKYLEYPLRLTNRQLFTVSPGKAQAKMRIMAWLLAFRVALLIYYAHRVLLHEIDRELLTNISSRDKLTDDATNHLQDERIIHNKRSIGNCPLCLDELSYPSALPCGHITCWDCIMSYVHNSTEQKSRCPVCRNEFIAQKVRKLHNYI